MQELLTNRVKELVRLQLEELIKTAPSRLFNLFRYEPDFLAEPYQGWLNAASFRLKMLPDGLVEHINNAAKMALDYSVGCVLTPCKGFNGNLALCRQCEAGAFLYPYGGLTIFSFFAALCHDLFRIASADEIFEYARLFNSPLTDLERKKPMLAHGAAAAGYLQRAAPDMPFCIKDAIRNHTIPPKDAPILTQITACADTLEPSRHIKERDAVRKQNLTLPERFKQVLELKKLSAKKYAL